MKLATGPGYNAGKHSVGKQDLSPLFVAVLKRTARRFFVSLRFELAQEERGQVLLSDCEFTTVCCGPQKGMQPDKKK